MKYQSTITRSIKWQMTVLPVVSILLSLAALMFSFALVIKSCEGHWAGTCPKIAQSVKHTKIFERELTTKTATGSTTTKWIVKIVYPTQASNMDLIPQAWSTEVKDFQVPTTNVTSYHGIPVSTDESSTELKVKSTSETATIQPLDPILPGFSPTPLTEENQGIRVFTAESKTKPDVNFDAETTIFQPINSTQEEISSTSMPDGNQVILDSTIKSTTELKVNFESETVTIQPLDSILPSSTPTPSTEENQGIMVSTISTVTTTDCDAYYSSETTITVQFHISCSNGNRGFPDLTTIAPETGLVFWTGKELSYTPKTTIIQPTISWSDENRGFPDLTTMAPETGLVVWTGKGLDYTPETTAVKFPISWSDENRGFQDLTTIPPEIGLDLCTDRGIDYTQETTTIQPTISLINENLGITIFTSIVTKTTIHIFLAIIFRLLRICLRRPVSII